jgi:alpha-N-arabinofuranosidase
MPVNVLGCIKASKTAAKMETTGLVLELYRKHFGNIPIKTETESNENLVDVQAALSGNTLTVGIVNTLGRDVTVKLDVRNLNVSGKKITRFEITDPENNPDGFNAPDQPYRIEIKETKDAAFNGQATVKPYSVTLLKFN